MEQGDFCDFNDLADSSALQEFFELNLDTIQYEQSAVEGNNSISFLNMKGGYVNNSCDDGTLRSTSYEYVIQSDNFTIYLAIP